MKEKQNILTQPVSNGKLTVVRIGYNKTTDYEKRKTTNDNDRYHERH